MKKTLFVGLLVVALGVLAGCKGQEATETVSPDDVPVVSPDGDGKVIAEAVIEPARWSELHFDVSGSVAELLVQEGDVVAAGDPLVRLDTAGLERAVTQAELELRQAQLRLERIEEPPDDADIEAARAAVSDAAAAYQEAKQQQAVTKHAVSVGDAVRAARQARDEAYRIYQDAVAQLGEDDRNTALAHDAYLDALGAYNRAVESAQLELTQAQSNLTRAYHTLEQAQNELDRLLAGADEADIETARLNVETAQLALDEANDNLQKATLAAPFAGTVATVEVDAGDAVAPGQAVLVLATLDQLQAHTTDLTELDVARIKVGQPVTVTVDALPEREIKGHVTRVGLQAVEYLGDVTYPVIVALDESVPELRWGMTAVAEIECR